MLVLLAHCGKHGAQAWVRTLRVRCAMAPSVGGANRHYCSVGDGMALLQVPTYYLAPRPKSIKEHACDLYHMTMVHASVHCI